MTKDKIIRELRANLQYAFLVSNGFLGERGHIDLYDDLYISIVAVHETMNDQLWSDIDLEIIDEIRDFPRRGFNDYPSPG